MAKVISVASLKGGTSKTVTTVNVAAALSTMGLAGQNKRVLAVDLDSSYNLTSNLGVNPQEYEGKTSYEVCIGKEKIKDCIVNLDNFDLLPSSTNLSAVLSDYLIMYNATGEQGEKILSQQIWDIGGDYDYIIEDNQPSFNKLLLSSIISADLVLIPVQPAYFSIVGLKEMLDTISNVEKYFGHKADYRIFFSMFNPQRVLDREMVGVVEENVGKDKLLETKVRNNIKLSEATGNQQTIFQYDPNSNGAEDYLNLAKEILSI